MERRPVFAIFFTFFFVSFFSISFAQQPSGPLQARDSGNRVVGPLCGDGAGPFAMVCRQVNGLLFRLPLVESGFTSQTDVYFPSTDCTVPAFIRSSSGIYPGAGVMGNSAFVEDTSAPAQTLTINSRRTASGACELLPEPVSMNNLQSALEFTGYNVFVPPFAVAETSVAAPLEAVDRDNRVVGRVCADGNGSPAMLCYQVDYLAFRLPLSREGFINEDELFFNGTNCTAPAAVVPRGGIYPSAGVVGSSAFVEDIAALMQPFTANSKRDASGACVLLPTPTVMNNLAVARELPNFNAFAAPFRVREAGPDSEAPQPPIALSALATSSNQVTLAWAPSLDNVGVAGYLLERCTGAGCSDFTQLASLSGVSFNDTGLSPVTTYIYRVRAVDSATPPNAGGYSNMAAATTLSRAPQNLTVTGTTLSRIKLAWTASPDFSATEYRVERCKGNGCTNFAEVAVTTSLQYTDDYRAANASYTYRVRARDAAGSFSDYSNTVVGTAVQAAGARALDVMFAMDSSGSVESWGWTSEKDFVAGVIDTVMPRNNGVGVVVFSDDASTPVPLTLLTDASVPGIVKAVKTMDFLNGYTATLDAVREVATQFETRGDADSAKVLFIITDGNPNPSTENPCGSSSSAADVRARLAALHVTTVLITVGPDISSGTLGCLYDYDQSRVISANDFTSASLNAILPYLAAYVNGIAGSGIPTAPALNSPAYASGQVNLTWTPSIDDDAIGTYVIERCEVSCTSNALFTQIASVPGSAVAYGDTPVQEGSSYYYRVHAIDSEGNRSDYSATRLLSIPGVPPTAPSNLTTVSEGDTSIRLSWIAATDASGISQYRIERCSGTACASFTQIATVTGATMTFLDNNATAGVDFSYRVRAVDGGGTVGAFSSVVVAVRPDTTPPTAPSGLTAAIQGGPVHLTWTSSTDGFAVVDYTIERCAGVNCVDFGSIATSTSVTYNDNSVAYETTYRYRVSAGDAAGNTSAYSNIVTVTTQSLAVAPQDLRVTGTTFYRIKLAWTAPQGFTATEYRVERCKGNGCTNFAEIAVTTSLQHNDDHRAANASYTYRVRARNAAGSFSDYSNTVVGTAVQPADARALDVMFAMDSSGSVESWGWASEKNFVAGVINAVMPRNNGVGVVVFSDDASVPVPLTLLTDASAPGIVSTVQAMNFLDGYTGTLDAVRKVASQFENRGYVDSVKTLFLITDGNPNPFDTQNPCGTTAAAVDVRARLAALHVTTVLITVGPDINAGTLGCLYDYEQSRVISANDFTSASFTAILPYLAAYINGIAGSGIPTAPALNSPAYASGQINLGWQPSIDDDAVSAYVIERCEGSCSGSDPSFVQIASVPGNVVAYSDTQLQEGRTYAYRVYAIDSEGNRSAYSNAQSQSTPVVKPTTPSNVIAVSEGDTAIRLNWTASTDASGIAEYRIDRCSGTGCTSFTQIATVTGATTTFLDSDAVANVDFGYRVRAVDGAGQISNASNVARAIRPDAGPPTAPAHLTATTQAGSIVTLTWQASTDGFAVVGYSIERCSGVNCVNFAQIATSTSPSYTDNSTASSVTYGYRVSARDAANNVSSYSNAVAIMGNAGPPTTPSLSASQTTFSTLEVDWTASTDDGGVTGYTLERCTGASCTNFALIATLGGLVTAYTDSVTAGTTYRYRVRATDGELQSAYSNIVTIAVNDGTPQSLSIVINETANTYTLTWTAGAYNVQYSVERCTGSTCTSFVAVATTTQTTYQSSYTPTSTPYRLRVRGQDALGNLSPPSNIVTGSFKLAA